MNLATIPIAFCQGDRCVLRVVTSNRAFFTCTSVVLVVALVVRIVAATLWQQWLDKRGDLFLFGDSTSYWELAKCLAAKEPYQYGSPDASVFRTPGYPWLLSWFASPQDPSSGILASRYLGCVFGTLTIAVIIAFTANQLNRATAIVAGILAALYPGAIAMSIFVLSEAPFQLLMILILIALVAQHRIPSRSIQYAIIGGILSGIAVLTRPSWLLFMPFYYGVLWIFCTGRMRTFRLALITGISMAVVLFPWWIRNYRVTGHFVMTTLQVGASLYDGLHPEATGRSDTDMQFSIDFANRLRAEDAVTTTSPGNFEYRLNQRMATSAWQWARANPSKALALSITKIKNTWAPIPSAEQVPGGIVLRVLVAIGMLGIVLPAIFTIVRLRPKARMLFPFIAPAIYFTLLHAVFVGSARYRQPPVLALVVIAAPAIAIGLRIDGTKPHSQEIASGS